MPPMHSAELDKLMDDFIREHTQTTNAKSFHRDDSVSVLIRPVKPMRLVPDLHEHGASGLCEETETDEVTLTTHTTLEGKDHHENAYWKFLSAQMRTVLQSIVGYSELIEEDLLEGELLAPLGDLLRIRSASTELLEMAEQIEELLVIEREKRHVAERLGSMSRQLNYAVDREAIFASLLSNIASLIPFEEACVFDRKAGWELATRWGRYKGIEHDPLIAYACDAVARTAVPCVQPIANGDRVMGFPIRVDGACVGVLVLRGRFEKSAQARHAGVVMAFVLQVEKALCGWKELDQIKRLAMYDGLTGALNRRAFMEEAESWSGSRSVIMLDIDHFKRINDTHGHGGGDEVLREIVRRVQVTLRDGDVIGRYGGEEFALMVQVADDALAVEVAERVRLAICELPIALPSGDMVDVTASLGVVTGHDTLEQLLHEADLLLYRAKNQGRNQVCDAEDDEMTLRSS